MNKNSNLLLLFILGFIWSSYGIFTKISAETVSPFFIAFFRMLVGGSLLYLICFLQKKPLLWKKNFKNYAITGIVGSAIPFILFAFAAKTLDSSILTIFEGMILVFEVLITIFILKKHVSNMAISGVILGILGAIITSINLNADFQLSPIYILSILALLVATSSFAAAAIYIKYKSANIDSTVNAAGSILAAAFFLSPALFFSDLTTLNNFKTLLSLTSLGLVCTCIVYIIYFRLIVEEGSRFAVTYSLLIPVCGTILGVVFLGEDPTLNKIVGCVLIVISVKLILNLSLKNFSRS
jgi:drug/metabolite transporter (DMT)-like permease